MREVYVLNGPNLNRLGTREPDIYGSTTFSQLADLCVATASALGFRAEVRQTNDEAELIGWLHEAADGKIPVVLNPAAFTHYSYALRDACAMLTAPLTTTAPPVPAKTSTNVPQSSASGTDSEYR
jgi:3-dehydroquinate dehydratase-2